MNAPRRSLTYLTLHTLANLASGIGAQVVLGIAVARILGPAGKGLVSFAGYVLIFTLTFVEGLREAISFQIGPRELPGPAVWGAALRITAGLVAVGVIVLLVLGKLDGRHAPAFFIVAAVLPFALYLQIANVVYLIAHHIERINVKGTATIGAGGPILTLLLLVFFHAGLPVVFGVWLASYVVCAAWSSRGLSEMLGGKARFDRPDLAREQFRFGAKGSLAAAVAFLALRIDVFLVAAFFSPAALGIYTLALASGEIMWIPSRSMFWAATGSIVRASAQEAAQLTARVLRASLALHLLAGAVLFLAGPWLIEAVYGARFAQAGPLLRVLVPGFVLYGVDGVLSYFISVRSGRPGLLLLLQSVSLVLCAALTYLGLVRFGLVGAAVADTLTYGLAFALKLGYFLRSSHVRPVDALLPRWSDVPEALRTRLARRSEPASR